MKKISIIISLFLVIILLCGCEKKTNIIINNEPINTSKMEHKHCTRNGALTGGEVVLEYDIYYTGDVLNVVQSMERVISDDQDILTSYESAYKGIHAHYEGLEYYDTEVIRNSNSVTSTININYDKLDIDKLISIEGEEDNIFINKKASVSKWLELAKKFGTKCELAED